MLTLTELAAKYGIKILGVLAVIGALFYLHHSIDQGGYDRAKAKYEARDTKATAEALGILAESKRMNDNQFDKDKLDYENRIKDLNSKLASSSNERVPIRTQRTQTCGEGRANNSEGDGGGVGGTGVTELAAYNRGLLKQATTQVDYMAKELLICSQKVREAYHVR